MRRLSKVKVNKREDTGAKLDIADTMKKNKNERQINKRKVVKI